MLDDFKIHPDESSCRFVKTIEVAGVRAIPDRAQVLTYLEVGRRLKLVRESENSDDKNAIRIEDSFPCGRKIGYIPSEDAEYFAPQMDKGVCYTGWIKSLDRPNNKIMVDVYERLCLSISEITSLQYNEYGFPGPNILVKISFRDRKFVYEEVSIIDCTSQKKSIHFTDKQWKDFVIPALQTCNFMAWTDNYVDPPVYDGTQWELRIQLGKKGVRKIEGDNDFPEEWDIFQKFISDCLDLSTTEYQIIL